MKRSILLRMPWQFLIDTALLMHIGKELNRDFFKYYTEMPVATEEVKQQHGKKGKRRKIVLQIEIEDEKQGEILKLALGDKKDQLPNSRGK